MKKLHLLFLNEEGQTTTLIPSLAKDTLSEEEVQDFMTQLIALDLFKKNGISKFQHANGAYYSETIRTDIF